MTRRGPSRHPAARGLKMVALAALVALAGASCTGEEPEDLEDRPIVPGGTLRLGLVGSFDANLDPQRETGDAAWELFRCCLLRTLLSYQGKPPEEGGGRLHPDLAAAMPRISEDGLTWTFRLRSGLRYGPPLGDQPIESRDVVRAIERMARVGGAGAYVDYFRVIRGFDRFRAGRARSIRGLTTPDPQTLVVRLTEPAGDLGYRLSLPAAAPIPAAADGHDEDYGGGRLVASGPYMVEGARSIDLSRPRGRLPSGFRPGRSLTLVRNPSWDQDTLRPAYADRIEIRLGGDPQRLAALVDAEEIDLVLDASPPLPQARKYQADPQLRNRFRAGSAGVVRFGVMNLAVRPFDDVHVRRAVNLLVDRDALRRAAGGPLVGDLAGHALTEPVLHGRLRDYAPYATPRSQGDFEAALEEMQRSAYDADGDGVCEGRSCSGVPAIVGTAQEPEARVFEDALRRLGIVLDLQVTEAPTVHAELSDPSGRIGFGVLAWAADYPDGGAQAVPLFAASRIGRGRCCNASLVGARPALLRRFGYPVREVPTLEPELSRCAPLRGEHRAACWAAFDRAVMEQAVPVVPYLFDTNVDVLSGRVDAYSLDAFTGLAAVDRLSIALGSDD